MFEKNLEIGYLLDFYGEILPERRRDIMDLYYNDDLSLSEIAEQMGITRQAVRDSIKKTEQDEARASARKSQVGSGDRSEKIRTYNYPQSRVTDHRIGLTLYSLEDFLNGNIGDMIEALISADTAEKLQRQNES